ncbi:MAG: flagellar motor switch protein FliN [Gemmatimonadetes bacterium]|nr:flagellar motor switch protein FliN [Gemmatimonadota bacterium]
MTEDQVETLDQSLRLNVEEGGEDDIALEWSPLEAAPSAGLAEILREAGAESPTRGARYSVRLGETDLHFLFFEAPGATAVADPDPETATEATASDASSGAGAIPAATASEAAAPEPGLPPEADHLEHLLDLRLPLTIRLGSTRMTLEELLRLSPGAVVELDQREDAPLEVLANGRMIARGEVVVVDERFGLRITEVGSPEERVSATV